MNNFLVKENQELICELLNILFNKNFRLSIDSIDNFGEIYKENLFKIQDNYTNASLLEKNKLLIKSIFEYIKNYISNQSSNRKSLLERDYEKSQQDFESYKPKDPEQIDFEDKNKDEIRKDTKKSYEEIMKQREQELNSITFNKDDKIAEEWINKDKDKDEEEENDKKLKERVIEQNL